MLNYAVVTEVNKIYTVYPLEGRIDMVQNRPFFGLAFCMEGQITYNHNGHTITSTPGCAVLLPKGETYTLYGVKSGAFAVIDFDCNQTVCRTIALVEIGNAHDYIHDFERMKQLSLFEDNRLEMMSIFYHMLYRLYRQDVPCRAILPAIHYIEGHYSDPSLSNLQLAKQCKMSEVSFRRMFSACYKMTPKQFIMEKRIDKAKQLLSEGALKISAVAVQCGFSDPYHFDRVFKTRTGITPTEYMRHNLILKI